MVLRIEVGLGPGYIVLDWDPAPDSRKGADPLPNFRPIAIVAKRLDASRCHSVWSMVWSLSPVEFVLDGDPAVFPDFKG